MSNFTILKNGRVIDPLQGRDQVEDVWILNGNIVEPGSVESADCRVLDVDGCWVVPGLIDMHVHLREPGEEYKETIASGTMAAAAGGFTGVACMPNTNPVNDNATVTAFIREKAAQCNARVYPVGAISTGLKGEKLAEYGEMKKEGAVAVSDDGCPVVDSQLMRRALEYASSHGLLVISHAEELALSRGGCMNEGELSTRMGLRGIPAAAESIMVQREIELAELTGVHIHIAHVSTVAAVRLIRAAKERGVRVTAETAPHYFSLTEEAVTGYNTNAKMNPPLRSEADRRAIVEALADGTIDVIATDHAPHTVLEKEVEFNIAANGIAGLETSLSLSLALVREELLSPQRLVELMSCNPAAILGVGGGTLIVGKTADVTVIDPDRKYIFDAAKSFSKAANSPFDGWELQGLAVATFMGGAETYNVL
ncbi:dihydroorotase [Desulforhopalus singaporensis]|uniref:Dihydroorotase n=1 Tax=Desulforhopalus singaporensis TaxID=91360 RepID=A0A1H0SDL1_9BACT|nr:dihydroorotase [Desulforhopalus singaporensis]SDP39853.1 dihydroorotase [Desulforhopalus singaporensis]